MDVAVEDLDKSRNYFEDLLKRKSPPTHCLLNLLNLITNAKFFEIEISKRNSHNKK